MILASRKEEKLSAAVEQIRAESHGDAAHYHVTDVRDAESVERMADRVQAVHGRIDFLVNNAAGNFIVPSEQLSTNGWNSVIGIVLNGTFYCTSAVGKRMIVFGGYAPARDSLVNDVWALSLSGPATWRSWAGGPSSARIRVMATARAR